MNIIEIKKCRTIWTSHKNKLRTSPKNIVLKIKKLTQNDLVVDVGFHENPQYKNKNLRARRNNDTISFMKSSGKTKITI